MQDYPLYPYLLKAELQRRLKRLPTKEVNAYLAEYGDTVAGRQLRSKWLRILAQKKVNRYQFMHEHCSTFRLICMASVSTQRLAEWVLPLAKYTKQSI